MASPADSQAIQVILQFLKEAQLDEAFAAVEQDSKQKYDPASPMLNEPAVLKSMMKIRKEIVSEAERERAELADIVEREGKFKYEAHDTLDNLGRTNLLSVRFSPAKGSNLLATSSVDKAITLTDFKAKKLVSSVQLTGNVLCTDFNPRAHDLMIAGCMNGSHVVVDWSKEERRDTVLQTFQEHSKYVVSARWAPDGRHFATASHDHTLKIYGPASEQMDGWKMVREFVFKANVEAIEFCGNSLWVSVRDDFCLTVIDLDTLKIKARHNMNAFGDSHVSFAVLCLSASDDQKYVLASTDTSRIIMFREGSNVQVRNFYGAKNGGYSNPRSCWGMSGRYVHSTSEDKHLVTWDVGTEKVANDIEGAHAGNVRDLCRDPHSEMLATCSYDKTVKLWTAQ